ncbi:S8 family peptidase [Sphingomonas sp. UV9]|uniref:S8 family peptidase n=1 Tax=Sphingomonas sp. UV9 TaxID=1851410 RepID=UPI000FFBA2A6|nr:S8 family peptidase [Sphingomonas sp. UV9]RXD04894.1 S8 family peptidase [Sphingomonas sp. UV9]
MSVERPHIVIPPNGVRYAFSVKSQGGKPNHPQDVPNREANRQRILKELRGVIAQAQRLDDVDQTRIPMTVKAGTAWGVARSVPGRRNDVLSSVGFGRGARLNVALHSDTLASFEAAAERYISYDDGARRPVNFDFFEARSKLAITGVADLWASDQPLPEDGDPIRWEIWVPRAAEARFREVLVNLDLRSGRSIRFGQVRVLSVEATLEELELLARSGAISQLRPASSLVSELIHIPQGVQAAAVQAAAGRITVAGEDAPAVCLLDTGVRSAHPLLAGSFDTVASVNDGNGEDWHGHGTKMAGLALFDDLPGLVTGGTANLTIRLESVKVQLPAGIDDERLPAERLKVAVNLVEDEDERVRTFCLAMSAPGEGADGGVAALSSELDKLAAEVGWERLFCVAAGNVEPPFLFDDYLALNETTGLLTPAQSWNSLTVAACTDLATVPGTHAPLAPSGDLSPWSRTSCAWERSHKPPMKPDVVFEGGNQMYDIVSNDLSNYADLCLLTTNSELTAPLSLTGMTSAATASVAGMCARLQGEYPSLWPETIRGLIAHSSEHTPAMLARARAAVTPTKSFEAALLERYGYGRPNLARAMQNAEDSLTFITQGSLLPLRSNVAGTGTILGYMRRHELPWHQAVLEELDDVEAELRITLSYFVEPNPGAALRGDYDLYASHGFDFDVKRPDESDDEAVARINGSHASATRSSAPTLRWTFGSMERGGPLRDGRKGCLKHDRLTMPAGDLARVSSIMVFPRKGWWGGDVERAEQQARYSLTVGIRTPEADIYTEIATEIAAEIEI